MIFLPHVGEYIFIIQKKILSISNIHVQVRDYQFASMVIICHYHLFTLELDLGHW